ncbi:MAG: carboxylesterase/lipase family protein [Dehalococcoidales bacterium]|nr:carboxylesterase/lipase family protein [Dehalococcoidales bacterium]
MTDPIVKTQAGKIAGEKREGLYIFRGVPYAAPPIDEKRWLQPQPLTPWAGVKETKKYAAVAPQIQAPQGLWQVVAGQTQSEDCLYLNIWTPGLDNSKRPVMLWIHGGGFLEGASSQAGFRGHVLARRGNAIIVTINYRLGALGFLSLNEITDGRIAATGNEGLLDQIAALQWVKDNIAAFGGDPKNVTLFGESAGGMSIGCQLALPRSQGLFHRAILQSGAASTVQPKSVVERITEVFLDTLGTKASDIKGLLSTPTENIIACQKAFLRKVRTEKLGISSLPFQPVVDGKVLPVHPLTAIREGASTDIPVIIGTTLDEYQFFMPPPPAMDNLTDEGVVKIISGFVPADFAPEMVNHYRKARQARNVPVSSKDILSAIQTDHIFRIPAIRLAETKQNHRQPAYDYLFTWPSPIAGGRLGACHAIDVGFTWGTHEPVFSGGGPKADTLSHNLQDGWLNMARTGIPSCEALGKWSKYGNKRETMLLGESCYVENDPLSVERQCWDKIPDKMIGSF